MLADMLVASVVIVAVIALVLAGDAWLVRWRRSRRIRYRLESGWTAEEAWAAEEGR